MNPVMRTGTLHTRCRRTNRSKPVRTRRHGGGRNLLLAPYSPSLGRRGRKASLYPRRIQQICRPLSPFVPNKPGTLHEVEYKKYRYGTLRSTRSSKSLQHTA